PRGWSDFGRLGRQQRVVATPSNIGGTVAVTTRQVAVGRSSGYEPTNDPRPVTPLSVRRSNGDEDVLPLAVDQKHRRSVGRASDRGAQFVYRVHRLAVRFFDDVACLNARLGRAAIGIDV